MAESYRYIIHCMRMQREDTFIARDHMEFMRFLTDYIAQFGPIDLLYNVGRL